MITNRLEGVLRSYKITFDFLGVISPLKNIYFLFLTENKTECFAYK